MEVGVTEGPRVLAKSGVIVVLDLKKNSIVYVSEKCENARGLRGSDKKKKYRGERERNTKENYVVIHLRFAQKSSY
jgi:hypothetical protein